MGRRVREHPKRAPKCRVRLLAYEEWRLRLVNVIGPYAVREPRTQKHLTIVSLLPIGKNKAGAYSDRRV